MRLKAKSPNADIAIVLWQGVPIQLCVEVDTDEGWADRIVTDDGGKVVRDGDGPKIERIQGEFTVLFKAVFR